MPPVFLHLHSSSHGWLQYWDILDDDLVNIIFSMFGEVVAELQKEYDNDESKHRDGKDGEESDNQINTLWDHVIRHHN